MSRLLMLSVA